MFIYDPHLVKVFSVFFSKLCDNSLYVSMNTVRFVCGSAEQNAHRHAHILKLLPKPRFSHLHVRLSIARQKAAKIEYLIKTIQPSLGDSCFQFCVQFRFFLLVI